MGAYALALLRRTDLISKPDSSFNAQTYAQSLSKLNHKPKMY